MKTKTITLEEAVAQVLTDAATNLDIVAIPGFGSFAGEKHDEHIAESSDGRRMLIPPSVNITFKPSVLLRNKVK